MTLAQHITKIVNAKGFELPEKEFSVFSTIWERDVLTGFRKRGSLATFTTVNTHEQAVKSFDISIKDMREDIKQHLFNFLCENRRLAKSA
jgi:hypothetical protein